jgi:peroxiredoxin
MTHDTPEPHPDLEIPPAQPQPRRRALVWLERIVTTGLLIFVLVRLGPQLGALTGVAPALGSAPDFAFASLDGRTVRSSDLTGRVVVVNFWATWCGPCRLEMPSLQSLHERWGTAEVTVLGLSTDVGSPAPIRAFLEERGITYPVGRATPEHRRAFGGIAGIPTTFIIDRDGVIRHRVVGYFAPPALSLAVSRLTDEAPEEDGGGR